ncbi:MAG TPA: RNA methyltransferase [Candidatus Mcinerneyibacterium sp.]|nr:RNA methyltransferase [Candidatus Mcinerneyibacterium sp.]
MDFSFALLRTYDSGNIGATLRALVNLGFNNLNVINPLNYDEEEIKKMAAGTADKIQLIKKSDDLEGFVKEVEVVYGFTARKRKMFQQISLSDMIHEIKSSGYKHVGLLFGNETNGLNNQELKYVKKTVSIDTSSHKPVLNLSQAVLLAGYELRKHFVSDKEKNNESFTFVNMGKKEELFENLFDVFSDLFFQKRKRVKKKRTILFNSLKRWDLTKTEFQYLNNLFIKIKRELDIDK